MPFRLREGAVHRSSKGCLCAVHLTAVTLWTDTAQEPVVNGMRSGTVCSGGYTMIWLDGLGTLQPVRVAVPTRRMNWARWPAPSLTNEPMEPSRVAGWPTIAPASLSKDTPGKPCMEQGFPPVLVKEKLV